jgi:hypothetical protein
LEIVEKWTPKDLVILIWKFIWNYCSI